MTSSIPAADACTDMAHVRAAIDALDARIVTLLAERMRYIEAAARIKQARDDVRDEARKAAVIAHARHVAEQHDFPPELAEEIYELLIEGSIARELRHFDALRISRDTADAP